MIEICAVIIFSLFVIWALIVGPAGLMSKSKHSFKTKMYAWTICFNFHKKRIVSLDSKDGVFHEVFSCDKCRLSCVHQPQRPAADDPAGGLHR